MKPILKNFSFRYITVKALILFFVAFCFTAPTLRAQDLKKFAIGPGFSINIGYFSPEGVNAYIEDALSNTTIIFGNTDVFIYYEVSGFLNIKTRWVDIIPSFAYAFAGKMELISDESFFFTRMSPGVLSNFHIPMGQSGKNAFFIGGGLQYHMMSFKEFEGNSIGARAQMGFDLQMGSFNLQPVIAYNLANVKEGMSVNSIVYDMDFTGIQIGLNMSFHKTVSHRRF